MQIHQYITRLTENPELNHSHIMYSSNCRRVIFFLSQLLLFYTLVDGDGDECIPTNCSTNGPTIQSPFWMQGHHQPDHCGSSPSPAFSLSCSPTNSTLIEIPLLGKVPVVGIDYENQQITINYPICLQTLTLPSSSPFKLIKNRKQNDPTYSLFSCPTNHEHGTGFNGLESLDDDIFFSHIPTQVDCLNSQNHEVYAYANKDFVRDSSFLSCKKDFHEVDEPTLLDIVNNEVHLNWHLHPKKSRKLVYLIVGLAIIAATVVVALAFGCRSFLLKKEDQVMVERFLKDYQALKPTRYTYAELKRITNNFTDKLGQGGYGTVYKGKLPNDVLVAVKILKNSNGNGHDEFVNEVGTIGTIHHVNVVRLVGYCADGFRRALVYEYLPNDSLDKFISLPGQRRRTLGWDKLQEIALGIAKGIEYLHQGCDQQILHFDIKPHNILLDQNFNPKVADFGLAKLCSKDQSAVSMTVARGTIGYIAPEVFSRNFGEVSYKSDVYSFGMLLLEMAGGRKNPDILEEDESEVYFPEWIYNHVNRNVQVPIQIKEDQEQDRIVRKLMTVGLWCIQWSPSDRPSMKTVVQMLEGDGGALPMPPNPFGARDLVKGGTSKTSNLGSIFESESESSTYN